MKDALDEAGVDPGQYSGHSFRIGAATTAAARGLEDSTVRTLGRWKSLAYLEYIKIPRAVGIIHLEDLLACHYVY